MKKIFLMLAFTGLVGSISASVNHDDKDKGKDKKETKSCCKDKSAEGKSCSGEKSGEKKSCCKDKKTAEAKPAEKK